MKRFLHAFGGLAFFFAALVEPTVPLAADVTIASAGKGHFRVAMVLSPDSVSTLERAWRKPSASPFEFETFDRTAFPAEKEFSLFFLLSGMASRNGAGSVDCTVDAIFPDGSKQTIPFTRCFSGRLDGPEDAMHISSVLTLGFPAEMSGNDVTFKAVVLDKHAHISVLLKLTVTIAAP